MLALNFFILICVMGTYGGGIRGRGDTASAKSYYEKSGYCPNYEIKLGDEISCEDSEEESCRADRDCRGRKKCCNSQCGDFCRSPTSHISDREIEERGSPNFDKRSRDSRAKTPAEIAKEDYLIKEFMAMLKEEAKQEKEEERREKEEEQRELEKLNPDKAKSTTEPGDNNGESTATESATTTPHYEQYNQPEQQRPYFNAPQIPPFQPIVMERGIPGTLEDSWGGYNHDSYPIRNPPNPYRDFPRMEPNYGRNPLPSYDGRRYPQPSPQNQYRYSAGW